MNSDIRITVYLFLALTYLSLGNAFFLRWGAEPSQSVAAKAWIPGQLAQVSQAYRGYGYAPSVWDQRKAYQPQAALDYPPIPISVPLQASLQPVSLQHVQLVPCMCPVAAEEADKLHEAPGPYLAQPAQQAYLAQSQPPQNQDQSNKQ